MTSTSPVLREWLAETLSGCCDGQITAAEILAADCSFVALGVDSLALVRLIDAVEMELDVPIDFAGQAGFLVGLDSLAGYLEGRLDAAG